MEDSVKRSLLRPSLVCLALVPASCVQAASGPPVPPEVKKLVFENAQFLAPLEWSVPPQPAAEAMRAWKERLANGPRGGLDLWPPLDLPGDVSLNEVRVVFLVKNGYSNLEVIDVPVDRARSRTRRVYYLRHTEKLGQRSEGRGSAVLPIAERKLQAITFSNAYKRNPMGMGEHMVHALTFTYSLEPLVPELPLLDQSFEGKAVAALSPNDGRWHLEEFNLGDGGVAEFDRALGSWAIQEREAIASQAAR